VDEIRLRISLEIMMMTFSRISVVDNNKVIQTVVRDSSNKEWTHSVWAAVFLTMMIFLEAVGSEAWEAVSAEASKVRLLGEWVAQDLQA